MKNWVKITLILLGGLIFYFLTGDGSESLLLMILVSFLCKNQ